MVFMSGKILTRYLEPSEYEAWDRFVDTSPHGSIYSQSFFLQALCKAIGTQFRILGAYKGDELVGGIGLHYNPGKYGDMVHIRALLYYNGLVIHDFDSKYPSITASRQMEVTHAILDELESGRYASAQVATRSPLNDFRPFLARNWAVWPRYTYVVPIADPAEQWQHVEQNIRRLISRCERDGMRLECSDDVDAFYSMNRETYIRKGVKPYISQDKFVELYRELKAHDACQIYFAVTPDGQRAAGQLVLRTRHPVTHTWMAGSDPNLLQSGASAFLRWKVFEDLSKHGYRYNDLTDAMLEKVAKFKSQFGGRLEESFVVYREISSRLSMENRINKIVRKPFDMLRARFKRTSTTTEAFDE